MTEWKGVLKINGKRLVYIFSVLLLLLLILFIRNDMGSNASEAIMEEESTAETEGQVSSLRFSMESGFYDRDVILEVSDAVSEEAEIYYTLDGSEPDRRNEEDTFRYGAPLELKAEEEERAYVYKFKAYYKDGTESETVTNTWILGNAVHNRFDTPVLCISGDPDGLFGYDNGIFVEGRLREEWQAEHPGEEPAYDAPANYNMRGKNSERPVYIELFEPDGTRIVSQNGGVRISGNFTRQSEQKSFKIYARREYDARQNGNKFKYAFFDDMRSLKEKTIIDEYETLKIRNTGNDRSEGFIRDELGLTLASQAGFEDTQSVRPVSVYINGAYMGAYWMHSTYDDEYFKEKYGNYDGEMVVIGKGETNMATDTENPMENEYAADYMELYNRYSSMDLTDDAVCRELNGVIDLENYLRYYAIEVYMANRDWPYNNLQAYRYVSPDGGYREGTVFDGRYRYLLFDVDTTMGLGSVRDSLDVNQSLDTLKLLEERNYAPLLTALFNREDCRKYFAGYLCDLANGAYSPENVSAVLDMMHEKRINEMRAYIKESEKDPELPDISEIYLDMQRDCIKAWAEATPESLLNGTAELWNLGEVYTLHMFLPDGTGAGVNSLEVRESEFTGRYLSGCEVVISPLIPEGQKFSCWEINGEIYTEEELKIDTGMIIDGTVYITLYTEDDGGGLSLSEIRAVGKADYIVLKNTSAEEISTWSYYLMDKDRVSHMNYLKGMTLSPGESVLIGCRNYTGTDALMNVNFNLKKGESVMLGKSNGGVLETVDIPDLNLPDGIYRKDVITGTWEEEREGLTDGA